MSPHASLHFELDCAKYDLFSQQMNVGNKIHLHAEGSEKYLYPTRFRWSLCIASLCGLIHLSFRLAWYQSNSPDLSQITLDLNWRMGTKQRPTSWNSITWAIGMNPLKIYKTHIVSMFTNKGCFKRKIRMLFTFPDLLWSRRGDLGLALK